MAVGDLPPGMDLTQFGNGLWIIVIALVGGAASLKPLLSRTPEPPPPAVAASLIDTKTLERLLLSFEATARVLDRAVAVWEAGNKQKAENNDLLEVGNDLLSVQIKAVKELREQLEEAIKRARDLTYQLERNANK